MTVADHDLLVIGAVFLVGIVASRVADRLRIPDVVLYLLAGILIGPTGVKLVTEPVGSVPSQIVLAFGASLILYEGGRGLDLEIFRSLWVSVSLLATVGVAVSTAVVGFLAASTAGLTPPLALLAAAVLAPTDPSIIMPVMRQVGVRRRLALAATAESALNDATGAALAVGLVLTVQGGHFSWGAVGLHLLTGVVGGLGAGFAVGFASAALVSGGPRGLRIFGRREHGMILLPVTVLAAYLLARAIGGSGFMAAFVAGVVNGNKEIFRLETPGEHEQRHREYLSLNAMIMRMAIFVLLGSQVDFRALAEFALPAGILVCILMLVARPLTVLVSVLPDRRAAWGWREILFLFWVRETGVIPAALASLLSAEGVPGAPLVASAVFLAIIVTLLLQASTTRAVARRLGVLDAVE